MADLTLYFAYGSNLDPQQMIQRCPTARLFSLGELRQHQLLFRGRSARWDGAVATIRRGPGIVRGVIYAMRSSDLVRLDGHEGHPFYYEREFRDVIDSHGEKWRCHTYVLPAEKALIGLPSSRYLRVIAEGYRRYGFDHRNLRMWGGTK